MATRRFRILLAIALGSLVAVGVGCSAASGPPNGRSYSASTPGCAQGDCSACSSCVDSCLCATHGDPKCSQACNAGKSTGAGGSGSTGQGGSGTAGSPGTGGSGTGGSSGGSGSGGSGAGGAGGSGSTSVQQAAIDRAKAGVGFSYWWGHGRFLAQGPTSSIAGSCTGNCPSCTHGGSYGGDCSGFAAKVWQVPSSNNDMSVESHPYSTADFYQDTSQWSTVSRGSVKQADAMVHRSGGAGHIFIYDHGDGWGSMYAYECKGCSYGCTAGMRTASSAYHAIRRTGY